MNPCTRSHIRSAICSVDFGELKLAVAEYLHRVDERSLLLTSQDTALLCESETEDKIQCPRCETHSLKSNISPVHYTLLVAKMWREANRRNYMASSLSPACAIRKFDKFCVFLCESLSHSVLFPNSSVLAPFEDCSFCCSSIVRANHTNDVNNSVLNRSETQQRPVRHFPLHLAVELELPEFTRFLLQASSIDNIDHKNDSGFSALQWACRAIFRDVGHARYVKKTWDWKRQTLISVRELLKAGANPDAKSSDASGGTALHHICRMIKESTPMLYSDNPRNGISSLRSTRSDNPHLDQVLSLLLCNGAHLDIKNAEGLTALQILDSKEDKKLSEKITSLSNELHVFGIGSIPEYILSDQSSINHDPFPGLCDDVVIHILSFCTPNHIHPLSPISSSCKRLLTLSRTPQLWDHLIVRATEH